MSKQDTLDINWNGETRSLFMSFGLLHELMAVIEDIPRVSVIAIDPTLRSQVLGLVFAERDAKGKIKELPEVTSMPITAADAVNVIKWVSEHVLDFFLDAIETTVKVTEPRQDRLMVPMPSSDGSAPSPGATPSAGAST